MRSDGLGKKGRHHRGVDPARETADHSLVADPTSNRFYRLLGEVTQFPESGAFADGREEVTQNLGAQGRVRDLGMELQAVYRRLFVPDRRKPAGVGFGQGDEVGRYMRHLIAMAHPDLSSFRYSGEEIVLGHDPALGPTVFPCRRAFDLAAQSLACQLHAVADPQHWYPQAEDFGMTSGGTIAIDAGWSAGENQAFGGQLTNPLGADVVANDLAVDLLFANPPGDQLSIL